MNNFIEKLEKININSTWYKFRYTITSQNANNDTFKFYVDTEKGSHLVDSYIMDGNETSEVWEIVYSDLVNDLLEYGYSCS